MLFNYESKHEVMIGSIKEEQKTGEYNNGRGCDGALCGWNKQKQIEFRESSLSVFSCSADFYQAAAFKTKDKCNGL